MCKKTIVTVLHSLIEAQWNGRGHGLDVQMDTTFFWHFGLARSSERAFASGFPTTKAPSSPLSFIVVGDLSLPASVCMHGVHALYVFRNAIARHAMSSATEVVGKHVGIKKELVELYHVFNTVTS